MVGTVLRNNLLLVRFCVLLCSVVWYGLVRFDVIWYGLLWFDVVWYGLVLSGLVLFLFSLLPFGVVLMCFGEV
jgi:hypothetical protein